jgi:hypothetical protein
MSGWHNRLARLQAAAEEVVATPWLPDGFDLDDEFARWERALLTVVERLGGKEQADAVVTYAAGRFRDLCQLAHEDAVGQFQPERLQREVEEIMRVPGALVLFYRLVPGDLLGVPSAPGVFKTEPGTGAWRRTWVSSWLFDLTRLSGRLPPDTSEACMRTTIDIFMHRLDQVDSFFQTCLSCGFVRPSGLTTLSQLRLRPGAEPGQPDGYYSAAAFYPQGDRECPCCRSTAVMWTNRIHERRYDWMDQAARELSDAAP